MPSMTFRRAGLAAALALPLAVGLGVAVAQPGGNPAGGQAGGRPAAPGELKTFEEKLAYGLGLNVGRTLKRDGLNPDPRLFARGVQDALGGGEPLLTDEQLQEVLTQAQTQMQEKAEAEIKKAGDENAAAAKTFLDKNKAKEGVKVTASGLQYEVLKEGNGPKPKATDTVRVHYHGTLPSGEVFDSSVQRGEPAEFPLNRVIKGWTEGVQLMSVGSKYRFVLPAELAYGDRGAPPVIGPNQTLVFEVELLGIGGQEK